jgi:hypothetical protein
MTEQNTKILIEKYPTLFYENFCFDCEDGWFHLIDTLSRFIVAHSKEIQAVQVKEKFAGLRFYTDLSEDYVDGLIDIAEELSYDLCERCGSNNNVTINKVGWRKALCEKCRNEESERHNSAVE